MQFGICIGELGKWTDPIIDTPFYVNGYEYTNMISLLCINVLNYKF